jgi:Ni/Co efflux regulator RcnB
MKNIIVAIAMTLSSLAGLSAPSQAASSTTIITEVRHNDRHRPRYEHGSRRHHAYDRRDRHRPRYDRHHRRDCFVQKSKVRRNCEIIVRTKRICR